ncbi:MAG: hypothetical protein ACYC2O_03750 [Microthrixaceae bacterium]
MAGGGRPIEVRRSSTLAAPAGRVWEHVTTMDGVNEELGPWVRMTHPAALRDLQSAPELVGRIAFHSWLLAGGVLPFDRHALRLVEVEDLGVDGGRFVEESTSWMQRRWRHVRTVAPVEGAGDGTAADPACTVTDELVVVPRIGLARPLVARIVPWLFERRHRRLLRRFGEGFVSGDR